MKKWFPLLLLFLLALFAAASGEEAREVTGKCSFNASSGRQTFRQCTDNDYRTFWKVSAGEKACVEVTMPRGETCGGVYLQWYDVPYTWSIETEQEGRWVTAVKSDATYYNDSLVLPENVSHFRIRLGPESRQLMYVAELHIYSAGQLPARVQKWAPTVEKADLMLIVAHQDDELLWFGGTLPTYAGEQKKSCLVAVLVPSVPRRRLELLDGLWTCGVNTYPIWAKYPDKFSSSLSAQYKFWNKDRLWQLITSWIRQYKPDVLLTQDIRGEYGHGAHRAVADACIHAVTLAADATKYKNRLEYGTWDVPKFYIHLYGENKIHIDWRQPLSAFGGKTGFDVAVEAFACHVSQRHTDYKVADKGRTSCAEFGLYRSLVGEDILKNDFFENLPPASADPVAE